MTDAQEGLSTVGKSTVWDEGNAELGLGGEQFKLQDTAHTKTTRV